jgi:hypothetical protein
VSGYLATHPELETKLDDELVTHLLEMIRIGELFGQPALA